MKFFPLLAASLALLLSGCMPSVPKRLDALSALEASPRGKDLRKLKLGVIFSENTRNALRYVAQVKSKAGMMNSQITPDDSSLLNEMLSSLGLYFGSVERLNGVQDAKAAGVHLIAVVDLYAKIGTVSFTLTSLDIAVDFRTPSLEPISVIRGQGRHRVPYPAFSPRWAEASREALDSYSMALSTSAELAAFAAAAAPLVVSAPQAAVAPAAPAAKVYRSDVESPAYKRGEDPAKFALVIGVEKYLALPAATHAARDARSVKAHLLASGYPERNIILLTNDQAGKTGIEKYLEAWLPRNVSEDSSVLFYFSGHGAPDPEGGQAYLMPWDGDPKFMASTGYPLQRLYQKLNALKARQVLVALDSCFSGVGGRSVIAQGMRPLVAKVDTGVTAAGRVSALTAAASDEITGADEESGHGLFTYQLLKGLEARQGRATFKELYDYVTPRVRDAARRDNREQTPQLIGSGAASL